MCLHNSSHHPFALLCVFYRYHNLPKATFLVALQHCCLSCRAGKYSLINLLQKTSAKYRGSGWIGTKPRKVFKICFFIFSFTFINFPFHGLKSLFNRVPRVIHLMWRDYSRTQGVPIKNVQKYHKKGGWSKLSCSSGHWFIKLAENIPGPSL